MNFIRMLLTSAVLFLGTASLGDQAEAPNDSIIIENETRWNIVEIYIKPIGSNDWGYEQLEGLVLHHHHLVRLPLDTTKNCLYDVLASEPDDTLHGAKDVNLCQYKYLRFLPVPGD